MFQLLQFVSDNAFCKGVFRWLFQILCVLNTCASVCGCAISMLISLQAFFRYFNPSYRIKHGTIANAQLLFPPLFPNVKNQNITIYYFFTLMLFFFLLKIWQRVYIASKIRHDLLCECLYGRIEDQTQNNKKILTRVKMGNK